MASDHTTDDKSPSVGKVLTSVIAGFFGVQSSKRRAEDFTHGKPSHYIVIGLLFTMVFILVIWGVVQLVVRLTTG
ncbi:MAG: DUF2970 domain-containing protein [Gammaproteobacteria bacterium]